MNKEIIIEFDQNKNKYLKEWRGVNFDDVLWCSSNGYIRDIIPHHNQEMYPGQRIMLIEINEYIYQVPYRQDGSKITLMTVFPSRKFTKMYLKEKLEENDE